MRGIHIHEKTKPQRANTNRSKLRGGKKGHIHNISIEIIRNKIIKGNLYRY